MKALIDSRSDLDDLCTPEHKTEVTFKKNDWDALRRHSVEFMKAHGLASCIVTTYPRTVRATRHLTGRKGRPICS